MMAVMATFGGFSMVILLRLGGSSAFCVESSCERHARAEEIEAGAAVYLALDHLSLEWAGKPVGFVSYGGISGGLRAVQQLKSVTGALNMLALNEAVVAPMVFPQIADGTFTPTDIQREATKAMLDKLDDWGRHLKARRGAAATG